MNPDAEKMESDLMKDENNNPPSTSPKETKSPRVSAGHRGNGSREQRDARSIFVGNLNSAASDRELKEYFERCGKIKHVTIRSYKGRPTRCVPI